MDRLSTVAASAALLLLAACSADVTSPAPASSPAPADDPSASADPGAPAPSPSDPAPVTTGVPDPKSTPTTGSGTTTPSDGSCTDTIRNGTLLLPKSSLMIPGAVAIDGSNVYVAASFGGQAMSASKIVRCTTSSCAANAPTFGTPNASSRDIALLAAGGKVYFTRHDPNALTGSVDMTDLVQTDADGSNAKTLYSLGTLADVAGLGRSIVQVGGKLVVAAGKKVGSTNSSSLVAIDPATNQATPIPGTSFDALYAWNVKLASDGTHVAWYLAQMGGLSPAPDGLVHVTNLGGISFTTAPPPNATVYQMGYSSAGIVLNTSVQSKTAGFGCATGDCSSAAPLPGMVGTLTTVIGDQVYFVKSRGACAGTQLNDFALVRCSVADAVGGACTSPEVLSAGWFWANVRQIAVSGKKLVAYGNLPVQIAAVDLP